MTINESRSLIRWGNNSLSTFHIYCEYSFNQTLYGFYNINDKKRSCVFDFFPLKSNPNILQTPLTYILPTLNNYELVGSAMVEKQGDDRYSTYFPAVQLSSLSFPEEGPVPIWALVMSLNKTLSTYTFNYYKSSIDNWHPWNLNVIYDFVKTESCAATSGTRSQYQFSHTFDFNDDLTFSIKEYLSRGTL